MTSAHATTMPAEDLSRRKFYNRSFKGANLSNKKAKSTLFYNCDFDEADLSYTDFEGSEFVGCTFNDSTCYYTNFKDAKLAGSVFKPKDAYGVTFTMSCKTFDKLEVKQLYWYSMLMFAAMMVPEKTPINEDLNARLIAMIGAERYVKLQSMFQSREI